MGGLAAKGNPTALHFLFSPNYPRKPEPWEGILKNREVFLSRQAALQFRGFADAQMRRLQGIGTGKKGQRHELIGVHGYDIKAAMHVIRLLNEGIELMPPFANAHCGSSSGCPGVCRTPDLTCAKLTILFPGTAP
jgi:hypothetical protein